jgi:hypothetical protein
MAAAEIRRDRQRPPSIEVSDRHADIERSQLANDRTPDSIRSACDYRAFPSEVGC